MERYELEIINRLKDDYTSICNRRGPYSLRSYARKLGVAAPILSQILNGKRKISKKVASQLLTSLNISTADMSMLLEKFPDKQKRAKTPPKVAKVEINFASFELIADYWHFTIIQLAGLKNCPSDPTWIAKRLGLTVSTTKKSLKTLLGEGYLEIKGKYLISSDKNFITPSDIPSSAIKKNHVQGLQLAQDSIFHTDVELREFRALTLSVDMKKMKEIKEFMREMNKEFTQRFKSTEGQEVYRLQMQFYPLTKQLRF